MVGGWIFQKIFDQIDFPSSLKALSIQKMLLWPNFLRRRQNFENIEKHAKKCVFRHFLENFDQKIAFFLARASPSNLIYFGAEDALENF